MSGRQRSAAKTAHARARAAEHYGALLTPEDIRHIRDLIVAGRAVALSRRTQREHWLVMLRGTVFRVVYDREAQIVCTLLPPAAKLPRNSRG